MAIKTRDMYDQGRRIVYSITRDRIFSKDIEALAVWLRNEHDTTE